MRSEFQIEIHRSNHEAQAHDRLIATRDRPFFKTRDADACDLFVCTSRISDAARFEYAIASAAKRLRSNGLRGSWSDRHRQFGLSKALPATAPGSLVKRKQFLSSRLRGNARGHFPECGFHISYASRLQIYKFCRALPGSVGYNWGCLNVVLAAILIKVTESKAAFISSNERSPT